MAKSGKKRAKAEKAKTQLKTSMKQAKKPKKKKDGIRSVEQRLVSIASTHLHRLQIKDNCVQRPLIDLFT